MDTLYKEQDNIYTLGKIGKFSHHDNYDGVVSKDRRRAVVNYKDNSY